MRIRNFKKKEQVWHYGEKRIQKETNNIASPEVKGCMKWESEGCKKEQVWHYGEKRIPKENWVWKIWVKITIQDHNVSCSRLGPVCAHQNIRSQIWHLTWWSTQIFSNGHIGKLSGGMPIHHAQQENFPQLFF